MRRALVGSRSVGILSIGRWKKDIGAPAVLTANLVCGATCADAAAAVASCEFAFKTLQ